MTCSYQRGSRSHIIRPISRCLELGVVVLDGHPELGVKRDAAIVPSAGGAFDPLFVALRVEGDI